MKTRAAIKNTFHLFRRYISSLGRPSKAENMRRMKKRGEDINAFITREMKIEDIPGITAVHVKAWADTYWAVKNPPTWQVREWQWKEQFKITDGSWFCYVVENEKGKIVGFAKGKRYDSKDLPGYSGELNKLYLLWEYHRLGLGRKLVCAVAKRFLHEGITNMVLFGDPGNPTCAFYEAMGGEKLYAANGEFHGGYAWKDLQQLALICNNEN